MNEHKFNERASRNMFEERKRRSHTGKRLAKGLETYKVQTRTVDGIHSASTLHLNCCRLSQMLREIVYESLQFLDRDTLEVCEIASGRLRDMIAGSKTIVALRLFTW